MIIYSCDGCGLYVDSDRGLKDEFCRPADWYIRCDEFGERHFCSKECLDNRRAFRDAAIKYAKSPSELI